MSSERYVVSYSPATTSIFKKNCSQFEPIENPIANEMKASMDLLSKMESDNKKMRKAPLPEDADLNVRKAVRFASKGRGGVALGREVAGGGRSSRGRGGGGGGKKGRR